ncbi:MAG: methyltransferase domain-containing protein [Deltaproteobacteria bacterium]|nr:methyltransferase domain-containing protein [Deltaproteobacteria bacterium]
MRRGHVCPWWLAYGFDNPFRRLIHDPQRIFAGLVRRGETALDVGCGMGYFSLALAGIVGEDGQVIAADLQPQMLERVRRRALRGGLQKRIRLHRCEPGKIGLREKVDFALAFWMVHEIPEKGEFMGELHGLLRPGGRLLLVEPRLHVSGREFRRTLQIASQEKLFPLRNISVALSRAALLGPN